MIGRALELGTCVTVEAVTLGFRAVNLAHEVGRLNPVYRVWSDAVLDTLFGPYEDWDSEPLTTR